MANYRKEKKRLTRKLRQERKHQKILELQRSLETAKADPKKKEKNRGYRELATCSIRQAEGEGKERTFIISFSSEEPYGRWFGTEILDHSEGCVDLDRLNSIGCVLFNHDRNKVVGKVKRAWVENSRGCAEIEFDTDEASETIYQKVKNETLKGVSVGYMIDVWEEVMPNKASADGRFTGPCSIAKKWAPYEVSIVSVPADPTVGVGREVEEDNEDGDPGEQRELSLEMYERQLQINKNLIEEENES